jgi:hypothetical protein
MAPDAPARKMRFVMVLVLERIVSLDLERDGYRSPPLSSCASQHTYAQPAILQRSRQQAQIGPVIPHHVSYPE